MVENGYYWFRNVEGTTFIALLEGDGLWYLPGIENPVSDLEDHDTLLGMVVRSVVNGGSIDGH